MKSSPFLLRKLFSVGLVALMFFSLIMVFVPVTHAAQPTVNHTVSATNGAGASTGVTSGALVTAVGNQIIVVCFALGGGIPWAAPTATDSAGDAFTLYNSGSVNVGANAETTGVYAATSTTASVTVTCTSQGSGNWNAVVAYDVSGATLNAFCINSGTGSGTALSTSTQCTAPANSPYIAVSGLYSSGGTTTAGSGFTGQSPTCGGSSNCLGQYTLGSIFPNSFPGTSVAGTWNDVAVVFAAGSASSGTQTQNIGQCPGKNTATFTMANSTIYMYYGTAPGNIAVQNIETFVASVTGSQPRTLRLLLYETQSPPNAGLTLNTGSVSVGFPLFKIIDQSYVLTAGTKNSLILANVAVGVTQGNLWGVGIVGDNHILINQSSTSGLFTEAGNPSTGSQPNKFTTAGSGSATQLFLCAGSVFQSQLFQTTTTTQSASTTVSTTITNTISTIGPGFFNQNSNWPVVFLILLLPAGLFLGVTKNIAGALLGLMIGSIIGVMMGILPPWAFIGIIIALAAIAFISRERG